MLVGSFIYSCVYPPLHAMEIYGSPQFFATK